MKTGEQAAIKFAYKVRSWVSNNTIVKTKKRVTTMHIHGFLVATLKREVLEIVTDDFLTPTVMDRLNCLLKIYGTGYELINRKKGRWDYKSENQTLPWPGNLTLTIDPNKVSFKDK